jgi:hypothetical protein
MIENVRKQNSSGTGFQNRSLKPPKKKKKKKRKENEPSISIEPATSRLNCDRKANQSFHELIKPG